MFLVHTPMKIWLATQGVFLLRLVIAAACGAAVGLEREKRLKTAGIRTHIIVCLASALMMIISKYGFFDVAGQTGINLDPSRIAAGIVTAIGFLGAGVIFVQNRTVNGVTTAAGIWATVGIGMSIGAGLYLLGGVTAALIIVLQMLLHRHLPMLKSPTVERICFRILPGTEPRVYIDALECRKVKVVSSVLTRLPDEAIEIQLTVRFPESFSLEDAIALLQEHPAVQSVEL